MFSLLSPWAWRNEGHELQTSSDNHGGVRGTSPPSFLFGVSQRNTAHRNPHGPMACLLIDRPIWKDVGVQPGGPFLHLLRVRGRKSHGSGHGCHDHGRSGHGWLTFHGSFPGRKKGFIGGITTHSYIYIYTRMCVCVCVFICSFIYMFVYVIHR